MIFLLCCYPVGGPFSGRKRLLACCLGQGKVPVRGDQHFFQPDKDVILLAMLVDRVAWSCFQALLSIDLRARNPGSGTGWFAFAHSFASPDLANDAARTAVLCSLLFLLAGGSGLRDIRDIESRQADTLQGNVLDP